MIIFWIWLAGSLSIYAYRAYFRVTGKSQRQLSPENSESEAGQTELPLDSPDRWLTSQADDNEQIDQTEPVTDSSASDPVESNSSAELPVAKIAARLEPLPDEDEIEPSVLAAMSPTERAQVTAAAASAPGGGGLFDLAVIDHAPSIQYDHALLADLLLGVSLPNDLVPSVETDPSPTQAAFCTSSATEGQIAADLAVELRRLGFVVTPQPPAGALAIRDSSAIEVLITTAEQDEDDDSAPKVTVEIRSL